MFRIYLTDLDYRLFKFFNSFAGVSPALDRTFVIFAEFTVFLIIALLAVFVLAKRQSSRYSAVLQAFTAGFFSRVIFDSLVYIFFFRARPFVSAIVNQLMYHNPLEPSFPSGHASIMFAMAFSLFFASRKWGIAYLILALISSLSRVVAGIHYPMDVISGILIGLMSAFVAKWIFEFWFSEKPRKEEARK